MAEDAKLISWLEAHGLAACAEALIANDVGLDILPDVTDADLTEIGLSLGMRRRLLKAAATLRPTQPAAATPTIDDLARSAAAAPAGGERRHLIVMFCDLVGSTVIAGKLDAEEWRDLLADYHKIVADSVTRFGGFVAQKLGDGALVYFGYPEAHENDAERAVRAGLALLAGLVELNRADPRRPEIATRIGIHAGPVVMDANGFVFGEVPNVAARVQTAAGTGEVVISAPVHREIAGLVLAEDRGPQSLKGVAEPLNLYRVMRVSGTGKRRLAGRPATPFVGREGELASIGQAWDRARSKKGGAIWVTGDAGMGKSRLIEEFQSRIAETPHSWVAFPCAQLAQNTPFHAVAEWGRQRFPVGDGGDGQRLADLEFALGAVGLDREIAVPLIASVLDISLSPNYAKPVASAEEQRRRQIAMAVQWILSGARAQSMVLVVSDVQWADPSTLEIIRLLSEAAGDAPLLVLVTARRDFPAPWPRRQQESEIALAPLARSDAERLIAKVAAAATIPAETIEAIVSRSGGVPLYLEEVTRLLLEGGDKGGAHQVPPTLQASLTARLDRLGPAKEVAQIGAVLGREFGWPMIELIAGMGEAELRAALDKLAVADMLQSQGVPPDAIYRFNHALFQDAAYDALLKSRRRELHRAVAKALNEDFAFFAQLRPELLAHHLTEAGDGLPAIAAWRKAGEIALARGAFAEAGAHFNRGIEVLRSLPEPAKHVAEEFQLRSQLAQCYWASKGFAAPETRAAFEEALALGENAGDVRALATVLSGLAAAMTQQAEYDGAQVFADRLSTLASRDGGAFEQGWAAVRQSAIAFYRGDLAEAGRQIGVIKEHAAAAEKSAIGGVSLTGMARIYAPWVAAIAGRSEEANREAEEGIRWAATCGPHDRAFALTGALMARLHGGDIDGTQKLVGELLALTQQYNLRVLHASTTMFGSWVTLARGDGVKAVAEISAGLDTYRAIGQKILLNWFTAMLAEAQALTGDLATAAVSASWAVAHNHLTPVYAPEVLRIQGLVLARL